MSETSYTEDCCFNYVRDHCKGRGCICGCHQPRSVMRTKHQSDAAFLAWVGSGEGADKLCTHTVQAAFREGWNASQAEQPLAAEIERYRQRSRDEDTARIRLNHDRLEMQEALATIVGAFTSGVYCSNCGESVDDCDCIIAQGRKALS